MRKATSVAPVNTKSIVISIPAFREEGDEVSLVLSVLMLYFNPPFREEGDIRVAISSN